MTCVAEIAARLPGAVVRGDALAEVSGVTHDSREVRPGDLFAALSGGKADGRDFVSAALRGGAAALLVEEFLPGVPDRVAQIRVPDPRRSLGPAAAACYGDPTAKLQVIGITGTNGKTTTTYLVESVLAAAGGRPGVIGTVEYRYGDVRRPANHTTPEASAVQAMAREMVDAGTTHLVMEVSSHGLALHRLEGCHFRVTAFTNLTQDHLDFHGTMAEYAAAKLTLFTTAITGEARARIVLNLDDPFTSTILEKIDRRALTVSTRCESSADIKPAALPRYGIDGIETTLCTPAGSFALRSPLLGEHNLSNLLLALGIALSLEMDGALAASALGAVRSVPGRLERVEGGAELAVLVDYAHTPDALTRVLAALRPLTRGRLICVFGCGGDRDHKKRALMGAAVRDHADLVVVTSDNPRTEDPEAIVAMILEGVRGTDLPRLEAEALGSARRGHHVEVDRRTAIRAAIAAAAAGDTVLIAGKGHEDYQIRGTEKAHFDDREEAAAALATRDARRCHG